MSLRGRYVIAGVGHTAFGKLPGSDTVSLNVEACRGALADARVDKSVVDAVFVKVPTSAHQFMFGQKVAEALGIAPRMGGAWDQGGAANVTLISFAIMAIEAGQCEVALICYADNPRSGSRAVYGRPRGDDAAYGWLSTAAGYAMIHRRHVIEHGTRPEHFGAVALACRRHGAGNPNAQLRSPLTMDAYLSSPWVVDPLRRDDCALVSDGAAALVVMSASARASSACRSRCRCSASGTDRHRSSCRSARRSRAPRRRARRVPRSRWPAWGRRTSTSPSSTTASRSPC